MKNDNLLTFFGNYADLNSVVRPTLSAPYEAIVTRRRPWWTDVGDKSHWTPTNCCVVVVLPAADDMAVTRPTGKQLTNASSRITTLVDRL